MMSNENFMAFATQFVEKVIPEIEKCYHVDAGDKNVTLSSDGTVCLYVEGRVPEWNPKLKDWICVDFRLSGDGEEGQLVIGSMAEYGVKMPKGDYSQCVWLVPLPD